MRGRLVTLLACAETLCLASARPAPAARGGLAARAGSVRYAARIASTAYDDQGWNAGFERPTPAYPTAPKDVATASPSAGSWTPGRPTNRINDGSIQNSGGPSVAGAGSPTGNPVWLLVGMSNYLARQRQLTMWITMTSERVAESGQKIQVTSRQITYVQRPDKLAVDVSTDQTHTRIVYDGQITTVVETTRNFYGTIPVQGTLDAVLDKLAQDYGMAVPADDLLYKGAFERLNKRIRSAEDLGTEMIDGRMCSNVALTGASVDAQIWFESGPAPMPRRVVITYKDRPGRPRCRLEITRWETNPISPSVFKADIPAGAQEIRILPHQRTNG